MNKTVIAVEEVRRLKARLREINALDLKDIVWTEDGKEVEVPPARLEEWRFIGMNNADFIDTNYYTEGFRHMIVCQPWSSYAGDMAEQPIGYTLHRDNQSHAAYCEQHLRCTAELRAGRGDALCYYHAPDGDAYNILADEALYERLGDEGKWFYGSPPEPYQY